MREKGFNRRAGAALLAVVAMLAALLATGPAAASTTATIPEIQGAGHVSPLAGQSVTTTGVVTAVAFNGYYVQDPVGDGDDNTADGIFVFSRQLPEAGGGRPARTHRHGQRVHPRWLVDRQPVDDAAVVPEHDAPFVGQSSPRTRWSSAPAAGPRRRSM